ncbi:MAG: hypothetical protein J6T97_06940 [Bacteroidaceae bacterium]|uniref:hypothetical protein n=1 Tax=Ruminococcus sp. TaxID=41978 RepID=UPI001B2AF797|nr:hypothetical protein [Ruminococcus sp.]MBO7437538.1 hypothetical protein [Bacteroidaceae bacterium]MBP5432340.1 hypothetical protein [Ruminococcus sp.]
MKAYYAPKRLSLKEAKATTQQALECVAPAVTAAVLFVLYRRGWHKDKITELYKEIVNLFKYPADEIKAYLTNKCGIDWNELVKAVKVE